MIFHTQYPGIKLLGGVWGVRGAGESSSLVTNESLASVSTGACCLQVGSRPSLGFNSTSKKTLRLFIHTSLNVKKKKKSSIRKYILNFSWQFPILPISLFTPPTPGSPKIISKRCPSGTRNRKSTGTDALPCRRVGTRHFTPTVSSNSHSNPMR